MTFLVWSLTCGCWCFGEGERRAVIVMATKFYSVYNTIAIKPKPNPVLKIIWRAVINQMFSQETWLKEERVG